MAGEDKFICSDPYLAANDAGVDFVLRKGNDRCSFRVAPEALDDLGQAPEGRSKDLLLLFLMHQERIVERASTLFVAGAPKRIIYSREL